jgi:hypothetical protein
MSDISAAAEATAENRSVATGSLMSVVDTKSDATEAPEGDNVIIEEGEVTIHVTATEDSTNGKFVVNFDPTVLTFQEVLSGNCFYAVNTADAANGKLVITYAAASAISVEEILASLVFTYEGEEVDAVVYITTVERNEDAQVQEEDIEIVVSNVVPKSDDNTLSDLTIVEGTLTPEFAPDVTDYTVTVSHDVEKLTVTATANDANATVVIENPDLEVGENVVTITVTAENGDVLVYTITVVREEARLLGDVNGDGMVDVEDAMLVLQYDALLIEEGDLDTIAADVNGDGAVDVEDAMLILQFDAMLIDKFPAQG